MITDLTIHAVGPIVDGPGFLVAQYQRCGATHMMPISCKSKGFCASCMGRRMGETAASLVDHHLPAVPLWLG